MPAPFVTPTDPRAPGLGACALAGRPRRRSGRLAPTWVSTLDELAALRDEWRALWLRSDATPFQAPGAVLAWARTHAPDRTRALAIREDGVLVALAPVFSWEGALLLAGTGPTDYGDAVVERGRRDVADHVLEELARHAERSGLSRISLQQLRPVSLLLAAGAPEGWRQSRAPGDACPVAPLLGPGA